MSPIIGTVWSAKCLNGLLLRRISLNTACWKFTKKAAAFLKNRHRSRSSWIIFEEANADDEAAEGIAKVAPGAADDERLVEMLKNSAKRVEKKLPPLWFSSKVHWKTWPPCSDHHNELEKIEAAWAKAKPCGMVSPSWIWSGSTWENDHHPGRMICDESVVNRNNNKILSFKNVDKKIPLKRLPKTRTLKSTNCWKKWKP